MIRKLNARPTRRLRWAGHFLIVVALSCLGCARVIGPPRP